MADLSLDNAILKEGVQKLSTVALTRKLLSFEKVPFLEFSDNF